MTALYRTVRQHRRAQFLNSSGFILRQPKSTVAVCSTVHHVRHGEDMRVR